MRTPLVLLIAWSVLWQVGSHSLRKRVVCVEKSVKACQAIHMNDSPVCVAMQNELNCFKDCDPYESVLSKLPYKRLVKILENMKLNFNMCQDVDPPH